MRGRAAAASRRSRSAAPPPAPGLNTHPEFAAQGARAACAARPASTIRAPEDPFEAQGNRDALVELSGALKVIAVSLTKIANDLALMGSGPRAGIGELFLPELQKGSSIMPGKVNPVIPEVVLQVAAQVIGNDTAITIGGMQGQFELNVRIPLIARNLLQSIHLLDDARARCSREKCVDGIEANLEGCERSAEGTLAVATALNPFIGYDKAAEIVKDAAASRPHAARGRARARRRRGDARQGARPAQDRRGLEGHLPEPAGAHRRVLRRRPQGGVARRGARGAAAVRQGGAGLAVLRAARCRARGLPTADEIAAVRGTAARARRPGGARVDRRPRARACWPWRARPGCGCSRRR